VFIHFIVITLLNTIILLKHKIDNRQCQVYAIYLFFLSVEDNLHLVRQSIKKGQLKTGPFLNNKNYSAEA